MLHLADAPPSKSVARATGAMSSRKSLLLKRMQSAALVATAATSVGSAAAAASEPATRIPSASSAAPLAASSVDLPALQLPQAPASLAILSEEEAQVGSGTPSPLQLLIASAVIYLGSRPAPATHSRQVCAMVLACMWSLSVLHPATGGPVTFLGRSRHGRPGLFSHTC